MKFLSVKEVNEFFANWHNLVELEKLKTIRSLKKNGELLATSHLPKSEQKCPLNGFSLSKPCSLTDCPYNVNSPSHKNCVVHCLNSSKHGKISSSEASDVLNLEISEVNRLNGTALSKIRKTVVKERIERESISKYKFLPGHCVSCGLYIQDDLDLNNAPELTIQYGKFGWCSPSCRKEKSSWKFLLEEEFNCNYEDVIYMSYIVFKTTKEVAEVLELDEDVLLPFEDKIKRRS